MLAVPPTWRDGKREGSGKARKGNNGCNKKY